MHFLDIHSVGARRLIAAPTKAIHQAPFVYGELCMHIDILDKIIGVIFCVIGLFLIFDKRLERFEFLFLFDGKWKESPRWRKWKRIILGIIALSTGVVALSSSL